MLDHDQQRRDVLDLIDVLCRIARRYTKQDGSLLTDTMTDGELIGLVAPIADDAAIEVYNKLTEYWKEP
jgi:hypothetical protein